MPTYEYQCKSCAHRFEVWQKMADAPLTVCPECNGTIRRVLFPAGIVFKGSGFYKTDHGSGAVVSENNQNNQNGQSDANKEGTANKETNDESKSGTSSEKAATSNNGKAAAASSDKAAAAAD